ncbi:hypothetical protein KY362_01375 [Candidatus Woesearchaeota archaeon]|nr:hypothetical protein [Candidatus Woesearchaeota archaeon]
MKQEDIGKGIDRRVLEKLRTFDFPMMVYLFCEDTSGFQQAHDYLIDLGCLPKPDRRRKSRTLDDIRADPKRSWEIDQYCILPLPGEERRVGTDSFGWGIYRGAFQPPATGDTLKYTDDARPFIDFKYFVRYLTLEECEANSIFSQNPMRTAIADCIELVHPSKIMDQNGKIYSPEFFRK